MVVCCTQITRPKAKGIIKGGHRNQRQLKLNMFVASLFQLYISISYTMMFSSIYLFVTSSTYPSGYFNESDSDPTVNSSDIQVTSTDQRYLWSGLGESDFFYSWIATARGFGLLVGSFAAGWLPLLFSFRLSMLIAFVIPLTGNVLYATATKGWMILLAQFLAQGMSMGLLLVLFISYLSATCKAIEDSEQIDKGELQEANNNNVKWKKSRHYSLKDKFLTLNLLLRNIGWPLGVGISSVMAQFEQTIDQFRWPGWASVAELLFFSLLFLLVYREVETEPKKPKGTLCLMFHKERPRAECTKCCSMKRLNCRTVIVYAYLWYTGFLSYSLLTVVNTLLSPALSDHFGFSIVYISYFILGIMMISFGASLVMVSLKSLRVNNRIVLITSLVMSLLGAMLSADWQAIGQDPCHLQFTHSQINVSNVSNIEISNSFENSTRLDVVSGDFNYQDIDLAIYNISDLVDICTAGSSDTHECYWNPDSRITGTVCSLCRQVCRTESMSVTFVQFSLGIGLISVSSLLIWTALLGIATDCTAKNAQNTVVGMLYTSSGVSWIITPLWCIWIYDSIGKRLFGPMIIWCVLVLLSLVGCVVLYKQLGPITISKKTKTDEDIKVEEEVDCTDGMETSRKSI